MESAQIKLFLVSRYVKLQRHSFLVETSLVLWVAVVNLGSSDTDQTWKVPASS